MKLRNCQEMEVIDFISDKSEFIYSNIISDARVPQINSNKLEYRWKTKTSCTISYSVS